jgi:hypothetical protein
MRTHSFVPALVLVVLLGSLAVPSRADEVYGRIRGTVSDPTGAVIPGVKVQARNLATGISKDAKSAPDGSFEFLQLAAPATYSVTAETAGFKKYEATGIPLGLNQVYVLNIALEVGTLTQNVVVEAAVTQVDTTSMQLGRQITASQVIDLPLNGRNWIQLQQTLPGVVQSDRFANNYATNGSRAQSNGFLVNGVDANDLELNTPNVIPSPDAIAEVSVITNTINPEYGRNGGAILNAVTKSGTNQIHGTGFEFYRDTSLNTRNFYSPTSTIYHQNQFGGTVGGPIKRDKLFAFFSFQGTKYRRNQSGESGIATVYTGAERSGDFSALGPLAGSSAISLVGEDGQNHPAGTPYNVLFPTSHIPMTDFNSLANNLMQKYVPLPNAGGNLYEFNPIQAQRGYQYIGRVDYNLSAQDSIYGYSFMETPDARVSSMPFGPGGTGATVPGFAESQKSRTQQYALDWTHTFNGATLNEARFGYQRLNFPSVVPINSVSPASVGFTGINPQFPAVSGVPLMEIQGGPYLGASQYGPQSRVDQTYQVTDNFSKIVGNHTLKLGVDFRVSRIDEIYAAQNNGVFQFQGSGTYSTGEPLADFLLGVPDTYLQTSGGVIDARTKTFYSYFQDQYKLRPNLTITYGAGWQVDTPVDQIYNHSVALNCFRPGEQSKVYPTAPVGLVFPGDPGCNAAGGVTTHYAHIAPRLGFAWSPGDNRRWSIRGGAGVYFNRVEGELIGQNLTPPPFSQSSAGIGDKGGSPSLANPFTDVSTLASIPNKFPFTPYPAGYPVNFTQFEPFALNVIDGNFAVPYTYNYNLTIERQLTQSMVLSFGYVGLAGHKLSNAIELNPAGNESGNPICAATPGCNVTNLFATVPQSFRYPQVNPNTGLLVFGGVGQQATLSNSNYNAFQANVDKKAGHGLTFRLAYSWSHSLDGSSSFEDLGFSGVRGMDPFNSKANYGDSAFDARQRFVASYTWDLPVGKAKAFLNRGGIVDEVLGGWRFSGITTFQTGVPVAVGDSSARSDTCDLFFEFYSCWDRPNRLTPGPIPLTNPRTAQFNNSLGGTISPKGTTGNYYFDPNAFGNEPLNTMGNAGRNFFHGPGLNNFDFAVFKDFRLTESAKLEMRFESFNLFNHAQFDSYTLSVNSASSSFGRALGARPAQGAIDSRIVQLAAKIYF